MKTFIRFYNDRKSVPSMSVPSTSVVSTSSTTDVPVPEPVESVPEPVESVPEPVEGTVTNHRNKI